MKGYQDIELLRYCVLNIFQLSLEKANSEIIPLFFGTKENKKSVPEDAFFM